MKNFIKHLVHQPDGSWKCVSDGEISTALGRVQVTEGAVFTRGTIFMGVDIVKLLDEEWERHKRRNVPS